MTTSRPLNQETSPTQTCGVQDGHAKTLVTQIQTELDWQVRGADSFSPFSILRSRLDHAGSCWKTSRACSRQSKEPLLRQLPSRSKRSGIWGDGFRLTLSMRVCPIDVKGSSLSQHINQTVHIGSLLSAANCRGILRREERAGRPMDDSFQQAITETLRLWCNVAEASGTPEQVAFAPRYVPKLESIKEAIRTDQYCVARNLTWDECETLMGFPAGWTVVEDG